MGSDPEVLEQEASSGHHARWLWCALLLAVVIGAAATYTDGRTRARETGAVASCEQRLRVASAVSEGSMGLLAAYVEPARRTDGRAQPLHLADLMAGRARRALSRVQRADRDCRRLSIRPWHFSLVARRDAATAYSGALVTLLETVAAQGRAPFHDDATLLRLRTAAGVG